MAELEGKPAETFGQVSQPQLEIYAKELRRQFLEERRLRAALEEQYRNLQHRMKEIEALNRLFQQHLESYHTVIQAHAQVASKLEQIGEEVQELTRLTKRTAPASEVSAPAEPMGQATSEEGHSARAPRGNDGRG